jgi:hypothetical protein
MLYGLIYALVLVVGIVMGVRAALRKDEIPGLVPKRKFFSLELLSLVPALIFLLVAGIIHVPPTLPLVGVLGIFVDLALFMSIPVFFFFGSSLMDPQSSILPVPAVTGVIIAALFWGLLIYLVVKFFRWLPRKVAAWTVVAVCSVLLLYWIVSQGSIILRLASHS